MVSTISQYLMSVCWTCCSRSCSRDSHVWGGEGRGGEGRGGEGRGGEGRGGEGRGGRGGEGRGGEGRGGEGRAENSSWPLAIFRAIFYNGQPKVDLISIKLYRWPIKISLWPAKPKTLFLTLEEEGRIS